MGEGAAGLKGVPVTFTKVQGITRNPGGRESRGREGRRSEKDFPGEKGAEVKAGKLGGTDKGSFRLISRMRTLGAA